MLSQAELHALLSYDPESGVFRWKVVRRGGGSVGDIAGWHSGRGAWRICINGQNFLANRLAWFYVHGLWPEQVDHINGDRTDNRLVNLREATNSQNQANHGPKSNNRLGVRGVSFRDGKYRVQLKKNGVNHRAAFETLEEATSFSIEKSKELHGEFSIFNRCQQAADAP